MSIDYTIFMNCTGPVEYKTHLLNSVHGVFFGSDGLPRISGLDDVRVIELNDRSRTIMKEDFGTYGVDVNWKITGTLDDDWDILDVMARLYECFGAITNAYPDENCTLMRNGESFLAMNTSDRLVLSPTYLEAIPKIKSLFRKGIVVSEMEY